MSTQSAVVAGAWQGRASSLSLFPCRRKLRTKLWLLNRAPGLSVLQVIEAGLESTASGGGSMSRIASLARLASKGATGPGETGSPGGEGVTPGVSAAAAPGDGKLVGMNTFVRKMKDDYGVK